MSKSLRTITVRELIEQLQEEDQDAPCVFAADYGDHHHTEQALPIQGRCEVVTVEQSAYSNSGFAIRDDDRTDDEDDEDDDNYQPYVVIR